MMSPFALLLQKQFETIRSRNSQYSMRSFASMLGLSPSSLSKVLNDKQTLTAPRIRQLSKRLKLDAETTEEFVKASSFRSSDHGKKAAASKALKALDLFDVFANWYHFAILKWIRINDGVAELSTIAQNFGLTEAAVRNSVELLVKFGFLRTSGKNRFCLPETTRKFGDTTPNRAVREYHSQMLTKSIRSLHGHHPSQRNLSSSTIAVSDETYAKIVLEIQKFRQKISKITDSDSEASKIYALNLQLIPLSLETEILES